MSRGQMGGVRFAALGSIWRAIRAGSRPGTPGVGERLRAVPRLVRSTFLGRYAGTTRTRLVMMTLAVMMSGCAIGMFAFGGRGRVLEDDRGSHA